jgi:hypothetical protein
VSHPLLLDEMFSATIADQLRAKGHDALAVVADSELVSPAGQTSAPGTEHHRSRQGTYDASVHAAPAPVRALADASQVAFSYLAGLARFA